MEKVDIGEAADKIREYFERNAKFTGERSPLLDTDEGRQDLIGQVLYVLTSSGYVVARSPEFYEAANLKAALKAVVIGGTKSE